MLKASEKHLDTLQQLARSAALIRRAQAVEAGVSSSSLSRLVQRGELNRVGRGLYQLADSEGYSHADLVEAAVQVPKGVIVLLSALNFHGIGTHPAREVWMQLPANFPTPEIRWPPLHIVRSRLPMAFTEGVEVHRIAGHPVRITGIDRTIVDCFKHRNLVTLEVCLEALKERLRNRSHSLQDMNRYARMMRVSRVMNPYLEALV